MPPGAVQMSPSNPEKDIEARRPLQPPTLWSSDAARLSRLVGTARRILLGRREGNSFIEVLPAIDDSMSGPHAAGSASPTMTLQCREGWLLLGDGGVAMLCLLGSVPLPRGGDAARTRLRVSAAVAQLPSPLDALQLSLQSSIEKLWSDPASDARPKTTGDPVSEPLVRQRLHVRREDVSVYCDAWAGATVWDALLVHAGVVEPTHRIDIDELPLQFAFQLGRARTTAAALASLSPGDVVRMPSWLDIAGEGVIRIAHRIVTVRCDRESGLLRFVALTIHDESTSQPLADTSSVFSLQIRPRRSNHTVMNNHPFSEPPSTATPSHHGDPMATGAGGDEPAAPLLNSLDELSIVLTAEVGTLTLSVGALKRLAPGAVFDIDPHGYSEVVLCAGSGQQVAAGRLVDIDGYLGVQITRVGTV
jgi:type III secretion system YscQ/HrcQ family protein